MESNLLAAAWKVYDVELRVRINLKIWQDCMAKTDIRRRLSAGVDEDDRVCVDVNNLIRAVEAYARNVAQIADDLGPILEKPIQSRADE